MPDPWTYAGKPTASEHAHQTALFMWANMACQFGLAAANERNSYVIAGYASGWALQFNDKLPELKWLHAIKNQGHGDRTRGAISAAEGVKAGVADVFLPVMAEFDAFYAKPFDGGERLYKPASDSHYECYAGLYIEMKVPAKRNHKEGGLDPKQVDFQTDMRSNGYACEAAYGWEHARDLILKYLGKAT